MTSPSTLGVAGNNSSHASSTHAGNAHLSSTRESGTHNNSAHLSSTRESGTHELFHPSDEFAWRAHVGSRQERDRLYQRSLADPSAFWGQMANEYLSWTHPWSVVEEYDFEGDEPFVRYFQDGRLNVAANCLDRHLTGPRRNKAALIWQGEPAHETKTYTYAQLHYEVCKAANMLRYQGVKPGDRVVCYLPMVPELVISMLACARIGAVHCVVFCGLSAQSLADRIEDSGARVVITANYAYRAGKLLPIKALVNEALDRCPQVECCIVVRRVEGQLEAQHTEMLHQRDYWWHELYNHVTCDNSPVSFNAEHPLFLLYTSGSTARPKGIVHTSAGYLLYAALTMHYIFDLREEDVYWCTADVGWITGHSYLVYGPLACGGTTLMFEGVPSYPEPDRYWEVVEKHGVNIFYTSPTALRSLMKEGDQWPLARDLSSLRLLGTVGETVTAKAWLWFYHVIGRQRCPIVDTWWQTETGGILISGIPGATNMKPGSATLPFLGIVPRIINEQGQDVAPGEGGRLVLSRPWPGMMRGVFGNSAAFRDTYFSEPGYYLTGDGAYQDEDGYFWLTGRMDDVIKVSAHRIGAAEVENALVGHATVAEAAVVGYPHCVKGEGIYAYVSLKGGQVASDALCRELIALVRQKVGPIAAPDFIQFAEALPKTRSGKIMRRILRKIAAAEGTPDIDELGDTTTLVDPAVVEQLALAHAKLVAQHL